MDLLELESSLWSFAAALALSELAALILLICLRKLRRKSRLRAGSPDSIDVASRSDPRWVLREVERMCSGEDQSEPMIRQMTAEDRALFEVSIIDALNNRTREAQHRLRSALIKYGYDEMCARRVMGEDLSDRVRATALLTMLRPKWREEPIDPEPRSSRPTGSLKAK